TQNNVFWLCNEFIKLMQLFVDDLIACPTQAARKRHEVLVNLFKKLSARLIQQACIHTTRLDGLITELLFGSIDDIHIENSQELVFRERLLQVSDELC